MQNQPTGQGKTQGQAQGQVQSTTGMRDEHYNLVSVLYHALQGCDTCQTYEQDAQRAGDQELVKFFREACEQQKRIADNGKRLLAKKIGGGAGSA